MGEETFTRLYKGGQERSEKIKEAKLILDQEQEQQLKDSSIHKKVVCDNSVFERLHSVKKKVTPDTTPTRPRPWVSSTLIERPAYAYGSSTPVHKCRSDMLESPRDQGQLSNVGIVQPTPNRHRPGM